MCPSSHQSLVLFVLLCNNYSVFSRKFYVDMRDLQKTVFLSPCILSKFVEPLTCGVSKERVVTVSVTQWKHLLVLTCARRASILPFLFLLFLFFIFFVVVIVAVFL